MTISERIAELIDTLNIKKVDFAEKLNVTQAYISKITNKGATPSDRLIEDICEKFNVNESWLRDGTGEMFQKLEREEEIAKLATDLFKGEKDSFKERLIMALARLDEREWELLEQIAEKLEREED